MSSPDRETTANAWRAVARVAERQGENARERGNPALESAWAKVWSDALDKLGALDQAEPKTNPGQILRPACA